MRHRSLARRALAVATLVLLFGEAARAQSTLLETGLAAAGQERALAGTISALAIAPIQAGDWMSGAVPFAAAISDLPLALRIGGFFTAAVFLLWVALGDWVNRDSQIFSLGYRLWNPIVFFPFFAITLILLFVPMAPWIRSVVLLVILLGVITPYIVVHNKNVEAHQTVLTPSWWRYFFAGLLGKVGVKVSTERKADWEKGAPVELFAMGAKDPNEDNANLLNARHSPGYLLLKDMIVEAVGRGSERAVLDYGQAAVTVKHEIDGVWHPGEARDRESSDVMLAVIKTLANLQVQERRKKQTGQFGAKYKGTPYLCPIVSQGVEGGERVIVSLVCEKQRPHTYDELGMREGLQKKWGELMARDSGLLVFSSLPGEGLTTMTDASLDETDRLMRDFISIEELNHREHELQNIGIRTYDATKGETPAAMIPKLAREYPNVYIMRNMDAATGELLMKEIAEDRLVITSIRAKDAADALIRMLANKLPQKLLASTATAVLYQRLIRKLCPDCKVGYQPPPDVLKKLGIPAGKVQQLYRPPKPEEVEKPCQSCQELGFKGRTGIFELLEVTDQMREILAKQPKADLLRKAMRAAHQRSLQEEGILLVAKGVTSLPELMRVLKK